MARWLLLLAMLLAGPAVLAQETEHPAVARVREFLGAHGNQSALPDARMLASMRPYLARPLLRSLEGAIAEQKRYMRKFPGEKAPWSEGNLFHSVIYEDFEDFVVGSPVEVAGGAMIVPVTFRIEKRYWKHDGQAHWMDQYVLTLEDGEWRLSDVIFLDDAAFGKGKQSRLRSHLDGRWPDPSLPSRNTGDSRPGASAE